MDDFVISSLHESKNEWGSRLLTLLTPLLIEGINSIFKESVELCKKNEEMDKYLMTFQNFISRIPKWNTNIIETERIRIIERSGCQYLEDLITCVHVIHLKLLTAIRVGQKQKKIDISIPKLDDFLHKAYIHVARKLYKNVYLFEIGIPPLQVQKNQRELEIIVQECILNTIRESIPVEALLRAYMEETEEEEVKEEIKEIVEETKETVAAAAAAADSKASEKSTIVSELTPKTLESDPIPEFQLLSEKKESKEDDLTFPELTKEIVENELNEIKQFQQQQQQQEDQDGGVPKLRITEENAILDNLDVHVIDPEPINLEQDFLLDDIEILE
jgi:hypothetical protein